MTARPAPSLRLVVPAAILALCAGLAAGCSSPNPPVTTGGGGAGGGGVGGAPTMPLPPDTGSTTGMGSSSGGAGGGAQSSTSGSGGAGGGAPGVCASDAVGRPLATHGGGEQYHLAPGLRIDAPGTIFSRVLLGDVTGDGRADVVASDLGEVWVFPQTEQGSLGAPIVVKHGFGNPPSAALLHADPDSTLDLVVPSSMGLDVLRALGGGLFGPPSHLATVTGFDLQVLDINRDGHDDLAMPTADGVILAYGDGAGALGDAALLTGSFGQLGYQLAVGDVTGDQIPDLVSLAPASPPHLVIVPYDGVSALATTGWTQVSLPGDAVGGFGLGDLDADGVLDVVAQEDDNTDYHVRTWVLLGLARGGFGAPIEIAHAKYGGAVILADVNADGRGDVVMLHSGGFEVGVTLSTPTGTGAQVTSMVPTVGSVSSRALAAGDIDCDGCPDVVTADVYGLVVFRGLGCGSAP